ncbi:hypothetical protein BDQ17DRAFT_1325506 [Cyathus striatus]|nr:hypothetical protein BDQ17DRAFT_1325506 [Cyathus striatus]
MSSHSSNPHSFNNSAPCSSNSVPSFPSISDAGCAVHADGTLKDALEIQFFHDKDNDFPMAIASPSASEGSATEASIQKGKAPPSKICTSTCTSKPSIHVHKAAESAVTTKKPSKKKCPASGSPKSSHQPPKKSSVVVTTTSGDEMEQMDTEKEASIPHSKEELMADIHLVFHCDKTYRNPHTNKTIDGHWCMLCLEKTPNNPKCFLTGSTSTLCTHIASLDELCMEHAIHLSAKHFIQAVAPSSPSNLNKKIKAALKKSSHHDGSLDLDELDKELADINLEVENEEEGPVEEESNTEGVNEVDSDNDFTFLPGDLLGKALALVKQIHKSPQAQAYFKSTCSQVNIKPLELLLWICTQWASLYKFLEYFTFLQKEVLHEPAYLQQTFSKVCSPTVWHIIPSLEYLIRHWESMIAHLKFSEVKPALQQGIHNLQKWYYHVEDTSTAYFICLKHILPPLLEEFGVPGRNFDEYYKPPDDFTVGPGTHSQKTKSSRKVNTSNIYGSSYLLDTVQSYQKEEMALSNPHAELEQYLSSGLKLKELVDVNDHDGEETEVEIELEPPDSEEI